MSTTNKSEFTLYDACVKCDLQNNTFTDLALKEIKLDIFYKLDPSTIVFAINYLIAENKVLKFQRIHFPNIKFDLDPGLMHPKIPEILTMIHDTYIRYMYEQKHFNEPSDMLSDIQKFSSYILNRFTIK